MLTNSTQRMKHSEKAGFVLKISFKCTIFSIKISDVLIFKLLFREKKWKCKTSYSQDLTSLVLVFIWRLYQKEGNPHGFVFT